MLKPLVCMAAVLLPMAATARTGDDAGFAKAQARSLQANSPLVAQVTDVRALGPGKALVTLKLWSAMRSSPVFAAIPKRHEGWQLRGADGPARFYTPANWDSYVGTGGQFFVRYQQPVTIPVTIDYNGATPRAPLSLDVSILVCGRVGCHPQRFSFPPLSID